MSDTPPDEHPRHKLARLMCERQIEIGLTWAQIAMRGDLGTDTLRRIRNGPYGHRMQPLTRRRVEIGLNWASGSVATILRGGEPIPEERAGQPAPRLAAPADADHALQSVISVLAVQTSAPQKLDLIRDIVCGDTDAPRPPMPARRWQVPRQRRRVIIRR